VGMTMSAPPPAADVPALVRSAPQRRAPAPGLPVAGVAEVVEPNPAQVPAPAQVLPK
jgi:hypothetical protein